MSAAKAVELLSNRHHRKTSTRLLSLIQIKSRTSDITRITAFTAIKMQIVSYEEV
jgi:hypothetical protein